MDILHIWNQAGVSSVFAKYQRLLGHKATVIQQKKHDPVGISKYYDDVVMQNKVTFLLKCIIESYKHDVLHLHDAWFMVVPLRVLHPKKKIIIHYHGSLVRNNTLGLFRKILERFVDLIFVSTPDLLDYSYIIKPVYIPNPVDTDLFHLEKIHNNNRCFSSLKHKQNTDHLMSMLKSHNINVKLETKSRNEFIDYSVFPKKLREFEYYADIPFINGKIHNAHSLCGLQALSMGMKVIDFDFEIKTGLPKEHEPMYATTFLMEMLREKKK